MIYVRCTTLWMSFTAHDRAVEDDRIPGGSYRSAAKAEAKAGGGGGGGGGGGSSSSGSELPSPKPLSKDAIQPAVGGAPKEGKQPKSPLVMAPPVEPVGPYTFLFCFLTIIVDLTLVHFSVHNASIFCWMSWVVLVTKLHKQGITG